MNNDNQTNKTTHKLFDGINRNTMYSREKNRNIAICYVYNADTGQGFYTATVWRNNFPNNKDGKDYKWSKKSHRETAMKRFDKYQPIPFQVTYEKEMSSFLSKLKTVIRKSMMEHGTHGPSRTPKENNSLDMPELLMTSQPATQSVLKQSMNFDSTKPIHHAALAEALH